MKKLFYSFMAFTAMVMTTTSCSNDVEQENTHNTPDGKVAMTFSVTQETSGVSTRTVLATDNKVYWASTDKVTVWDGTAKNEFSVTPLGTDATQANVTGSVTSGSTSFTAVYPNSVGQNCTYTADGITGLVIPATQTATAGSYDPAAAIMVAQTTSKTLAFKHVCSYLKIKAAAAYTKIVVSTTSADIAGTFSVVPSTGVATTTSGTKEITLSGTIEATKDYYIAIAPCTDVAGLNVKCYTSATDYVERTAAAGKTPSFDRSGVYDMGETTTANGWKAPYTYVDLGLSVKWATMNVGATNGTTAASWYGDYFAWGETKPQSSATYTWDSYKWCNGSNTTMTKYCTSSSYGTVVDDITVLESSDDAATANWGGTWRMPTLADQNELRNNCTWTWVDGYQGISGLKGYLVTSKKTGYTDKSIFLPAAGYRDNKKRYSDGTSGTAYGYYWSSTLHTESSGYSGSAKTLTFHPTNVFAQVNFRYLGFLIRPVCE